ncbi:syntaxin-16 [Musca vetustissima]|uniref:syntaxin-16 n=1 Tax=Musca vetustissima TaxID=27455 RepID=UPI002AB61C48|nr:syntaxin-16 [Musca vetustissima]
MSSRNLTEVFNIMRNNASKNRNLYSDDRNGTDAELLLKRSVHDAEEGMELRDDYGSQPTWIDKLEEAQYTMSKIKPKLDELGSLQARSLLRPAFDESKEEELEMEELSQEISKLITSTHRHVQCIRYSLGEGGKLEQRLTANVVNYLMMSLQELTLKFRYSQNSYLKQLNSREERSQQFFDDFSNGTNGERDNYVDSFDNFLQPAGPTTSNRNNYLYEDDDEAKESELDAHFQRPMANRMTEQQLLLFEEENTRMALSRDEEVSKIVKSIYDLNDIFKDLGQMVQEQGTVLDRIDYSIEQTQTRVSEGVRQLQKAEMYQRKNRKMCAILVLAGITLFMLILLIFTKL